MAPPPGDIELGGGGFWDWRNAPSRGHDERWKKRRNQLETLDRLLSGIVEQVPPEAVEAVPVKAAVEALQQAAAELISPDYDYTALAAEVGRAEEALFAAERALQRYLNRVAEEDEDDDDIFLLSS